MLFFNILLLAGVLFALRSRGGGIYLEQILQKQSSTATLVTDQSTRSSPRPIPGANPIVDHSLDEHGCPRAVTYGKKPTEPCLSPVDPLKKPRSKLEEWFTRKMFEDLFPKANLGWGPHKCLPYSYESFIIAARYFPEFGTTSASQGRSVAAAHECFYRGGFYNWFEGGPVSSFLSAKSPGFKPSDGEECVAAGKYCAESKELNYFYKCQQSQSNSSGLFRGCYFGRGAIQISYNYNYGMFQKWLSKQGIEVDLLLNPNLIMTKMNPPLAIMASLWFYMTPQPPKPAMHDIVLGEWNSGEKNAAAGYTGPIFGPTSLIINNECGGEDSGEPGGPGENRRIKAFKWFCKYFDLPIEDQKTLSCKDMPVTLEALRYNYSYQPDWTTTWKSNKPCDCAPAGYAGVIPYFDEAYYPPRFVALNEENRRNCVESLYDTPELYSANNITSACLNVELPGLISTESRRSRTL